MSPPARRPAIRLVPARPNKADVIDSPVYPPADDPGLICRTPADRAVWAYATVEGVGADVTGRRVGLFAPDPDLAAELARRGATPDPPFDLYVLFDILDHLVDRSPADALREAAGNLAPGGQLIVRCHPWCSRHGTHLYHQSNKAFLSAYLTAAELAAAGLAERPTRRGFVDPVAEYRRWVADAGLAVVRERVHRQPVEKVFEQLARRGDIDPRVFPHMDITFVDYLLAAP
jgi:SAM-dependent methyltransferase